MPVDSSYRPAPRHPALGDAFFDAVEAADFPEHRQRFRNRRWDARVGLAGLTDEEWIDHFGRFEALPDNLPGPLALRYHGHQFQTYNPDLGDGRGFLFAQMLDVEDGRLLDLGTKGSGQTPWSRSGDGRLTLKGGVREVLATELLEALGVYTSKSLSLVETGEALERNDEPSPTRSSVLVRLNHSHIRFGSFQRHAYNRDSDALETLVRYSVKHYLPEADASDLAECTVRFIAEVARRTAVLAASWHVAGFVHGVLNTDNMNITGESFDYGPYRFLPTFDPNFVAAYFDQTGLYSFSKQASQLGWNLTRLAEAVLPLSSKEALEEALEIYEPTFHAALRDAFLARLNLSSRGDATDVALVDAGHGFLYHSGIGFEQFFFDWYGGLASRERAAASPEADKYAGEHYDAWVAALEPYSAAEASRLEHSYFAEARPCTLLIDEIESIWTDIAERDDWAAFALKLAAIGEMREALQPVVAA